jgi:aminopeptidase N
MTGRRSNKISAGLLRPLLALATLAACTGVAACSAVPGPDRAVPVVVVTPSIPDHGPVPSVAGAHHYRPGAASAGDPLAPGDGNGGYDVAHYALQIGYDPATKQLTGDDVITAFATQDLSRFNLDFHGLTLSSVTVNDAPATFHRSGDELQVTPAKGIDVGTKFVTHLRYQGRPNGYQDVELGVEGFIPTATGTVVAGEPHVAASWFPVNDYPTDKATYDIAVTVPSGYQALSNGLLASKSNSGGQTTWHWVMNQPMASYLATAMIGHYRITNTTDGGRPVVTAVDSSLPTSYDTTLERTAEVVSYLERYFGPYPFDAAGGIIHADSQFGFALENQTRPVYSPGFFTRPGDDSGVLAHELAHQWFGDSLSVASWNDLWLNEGFATYAEWLWTEHNGGPTARQTFDSTYQSGIPTGTPGKLTEQSMFDSTTYVRGAMTLGALRVALGDPAFFKILKGWPAAHQYGNVSTAQFIAFAEEQSGKDLSKLFEQWLYTPGKPPYPRYLG